MVIRTARSWRSSPVVAENKLRTELNTAAGLTEAQRPTVSAR